MDKIDELEEDDFRDAKSIIELLKENLTLWKEEEEGGEGQEIDRTEFRAVRGAAHHLLEPARRHGGLPGSGGGAQHADALGLLAVAAQAAPAAAGIMLCVAATQRAAAVACGTSVPAAMQQARPPRRAGGGQESGNGPPRC